MYALPSQTRLAVGTSLQSFLAHKELITPHCNVIWIPAEIAGQNLVDLRAFQASCSKLKISVWYPRHLIYGIMAHVPVGTKVPEYPVGFPCKYNQQNRETSILFFSFVDK